MEKVKKEPKANMLVLNAVNNCREHRRMVTKGVIPVCDKGCSGFQKITLCVFINPLSSSFAFSFTLQRREHNSIRAK